MATFRCVSQLHGHWQTYVILLVIAWMHFMLEEIQLVGHCWSPTYVSLQILQLLIFLFFLQSNVLPVAGSTKCSEFTSLLVGSALRLARDNDKVESQVQYLSKRLKCLSTFRTE